jgi:hypothetical protein
MDPRIRRQTPGRNAGQRDRAAAADTCDAVMLLIGFGAATDRPVVAL